MSIREATFQTVALEETAEWKAAGLPANCRKVYGIYLVRPNYPTYCCSMQPSAWCGHIENVFVGLDADDPFAERYAYVGCPDGGIYMPYHIVFEDIEADARSAPIIVEHEETKDEWEVAMAEVKASPPSIPLLMS